RRPVAPVAGGAPPGTIKPPEPPRAVLRIEGLAPSQAAMSRFALRLEQTGVFEAIDPSSTRQTFDGGEVVGFRLDCWLSAGAAHDRGLTLEPATRLTHRLMAINELSAAHEVRLDDVQPARPAAGERYDLLPIRVAGTGNYAALVAFLHRLHKDCPDVAVGAL